MRDTVERFGEVSLAVMLPCRVGNPVVVEGATQEEALERGDGAEVDSEICTKSACCGAVVL